VILVTFTQGAKELGPRWSAPRHRTDALSAEHPPDRTDQASSSTGGKRTLGPVLGAQEFRDKLRLPPLFEIVERSQG
jgi:hypothetical protein